MTDRDDSDLGMTESEFDMLWVSGEEVEREPTEGELLRWYVCQRKCRHPDEQSARTAAGLRERLVLPYECSRCGGWHTGRPGPPADDVLDARHRRRRLWHRARAAWRKAGRPHVS